MKAEAFGRGEVENIYQSQPGVLIEEVIDLCTSRCCGQCAIRIIPLPPGCLVEGILDIVHEPKHLGSRCLSFSQYHGE